MTDEALKIDCPAVVSHHTDFGGLVRLAAVPDKIVPLCGGIAITQLLIPYEHTVFTESRSGAWQDLERDQRPAFSRLTQWGNPLREVGHQRRRQAQSDVCPLLADQAVATTNHQGPEALGNKLCNSPLRTKNLGNLGRSRFNLPCRRERVFAR